MYLFASLMHLFCSREDLKWLKKVVCVLGDNFVTMDDPWTMMEVPS
jgi:hypothetical protein